MTNLYGFLILGICLIVGLVLTISKNHDVSYFPYFGACFASIALALDLVDNLNIMLIFVLGAIAIFSFIMALDALNLVNKK